jgi:hypothetical protein
VSFTLKIDPTGAEAGEKSAGDKSNVSRADMVNARPFQGDGAARQWHRVSPSPSSAPWATSPLRSSLPGEDAANDPELMATLKKPAKLEFRQVHRSLRPDQDEQKEREHSLKSLPVDPTARFRFGDLRPTRCSLRATSTPAPAPSPSRVTTSARPPTPLARSSRRLRRPES